MRQIDNKQTASATPDKVRTQYQVIWHNDSACDTLGVYDSEQAANDAGNDWFWSMVAVDPNPKLAEEIYAFEVKEIEVSDDETPQHQIEGTLANFNRYIGGDR